jgi:conjugal transfer mating pair stabilization protein TraN
LAPETSLIASRIFKCKGEEKELIAIKRKGLCHYVGSYCSLEIFGLCLQRKKTHCCFNSKLGRILQEEGRPTLQAFSPGGRWGSPKHPNCRGFMPEEFQMLDFSKIDLSEWYGDIQVNTQNQITNNMQDKIETAYDNVQ